MHFFCAKLTGWLVIDKYNVFCGRHKPRLESKKKEFEAKALAENRNLSVDQNMTGNTTSSSQENLPNSGMISKVESEPKALTVTPPVKPSSGKPSSFDRPPPLKMEHKPLTSTPKTGKPAQFEKMMSPPAPKTTPGLLDPPLRPGQSGSQTEMPRLKELLSSPLGDTVIRKPVISPVQPGSGNSMPKIDSQSMANSILSSKPELATFGEGKLSQLIETLFNESEMPSQPTPRRDLSQMKIPVEIPPQSLNRTPPVLQHRPATSMQNTVLRPPPMLKPKPDQNSIPPSPQPPNLSQNIDQNVNQNRFLTQPPNLSQHRPTLSQPPNLVQSSQNLNQSRLSLDQPPNLIQNRPSQTPNLSQSSGQSLNLPQNRQIPQNDGLIDSEEEEENGDDSQDEDFSEEEIAQTEKVKKPRKKYEKRTKVPIENVFEDVEKLYIKRGRARLGSEKLLCFRVVQSLREISLLFGF